VRILRPRLGRREPGWEGMGSVAQPSAHDTARPARPDPLANAVPGQELVYGLLQRAWSAWARRRYADELARVETFCLFIGYPRSGHSIVGALLNAHRHAVIAHELDAPRLVLAGCSREVLFSRILARAAWFNLRGNASNYDYQVPNRWQGRFEALRVIGDKRGGSAALWLGQHPDLLQRLRATAGVPLRLVHVVRNPFDNVAAIARWHRLSLEESIDFYFAHCAVTGALDALGDAAEVLTIRHEDLIRAPAATLVTLCGFLGLAPEREYLAACSSIVFDQPTRSRRRAAWSATQVAEVERRARRYPFLEGYAFEHDDEPPRAPAPWEDRPRVAPPRPPLGLAALDRLAAYLAPRVRARDRSEEA